MPTLKANNEILIAGAGPTGLALAAELLRRGIMATIIDRQAAGANTSRACVVHSRTLEVLGPLGAAADLLARGLKVPVFRVRDRDRALLTIDFSEIASPYPFTLMIPQNEVEHCLLDHLEELGGAVIRPCALVGFMPAASDIEVQVTNGGAPQTMQPRWLIGCDGMHSAVREQAGVAFAGGAYEQDFVLADVHMDWPLSREEVTLFYSADGLVVVAPLPEERFRIVATVEHAPEQPSTDYVQSVLDRRGPTVRPGRIRDTVWSSRFHIHHRVTESPRKGPHPSLRRRRARAQPGRRTGHEYRHPRRRLARRGADRDPQRRRRCAARRLGGQPSPRRARRRRHDRPDDQDGNNEIRDREGFAQHRRRVCRSHTAGTGGSGEDARRTRCPLAGAP